MKKLLLALLIVSVTLALSSCKWPFGKDTEEDLPAGDTSDNGILETVTKESASGEEYAGGDPTLFTPFDNSGSGNGSSASGNSGSSSAGTTTPGGSGSSSAGTTTPGGSGSSSAGTTTPGGSGSSSAGTTTPGGSGSSSSGTATPGGSTQTPTTSQNPSVTQSGLQPDGTVVTPIIPF